MKTPAETVARQLCADLRESSRNLQWVMVDTVAKRLGITFEEAETAADLAAKKGWIEHRMHSVVLRQPGRVLVNSAKGRRR